MNKHRALLFLLLTVVVALYFWLGKEFPAFWKIAGFAFAALIAFGASCSVRHIIERRKQNPARS